ncbi:hypothetical protein HanRHA438_Chr02g0084861 [Helianthus annuus]|nr:hypothetical protein HanRHA438_Chr02g0084861 [Helianthus annuus]
MTEIPLRGIKWIYTRYGDYGRYPTDTTTSLKHIDLGNQCRTLTVTRYASCAHGSAYVTSLHKLAETG